MSRTRSTVRTPSRCLRPASIGPCVMRAITSASPGAPPRSWWTNRSTGRPRSLDGSADSKTDRWSSRPRDRNGTGSRSITSSGPGSTWSSKRQMTTNPLQQTIEALAKEKGIEPDVIITAIEDAVLTASRKYYKGTENLKTRFNADTGQVDLFAVKHIVEQVTDPAIEISLTEAQELYGEEAEVDNATVKRFENGDIVAELNNRIEALLPRKEQSRAESYNPQDRVRAVIKGVNRSAKGPQIVLSRTDPALLIKLFEQEVPEIYDGTVIIRGAVREAGDRAKVAVYSRERDVDPVGACVGMKGTRVQSIIRELRGEKIDIVEYSDDPIAFVTNALSPAKVQRVSIVDDGERVMEVIVEDKQLSLAIGKKGQNVRLAAKLTGWRIDIKSEEEKRREVEAQFGELAGGDEPAALSDADSAEPARAEAEGNEAAANVETAADHAETANAEVADGEV